MSETRQLVKWELQMPGFKANPEGRCTLFGPPPDEDFDRRVHRLGLVDRFTLAFPQTRPIHYGWFIESPLNREQAIAEFAQGSPPAAPTRTDSRVLEYLKSHSFNAAARERLGMLLQEWVPYLDDLVVFCPRCHGALF
jgi:hypothetical protein